MGPEDHFFQHVVLAMTQMKLYLIEHVILHNLSPTLHQYVSIGAYEMKIRDPSRYSWFVDSRWYE